MTLDPLPLHPLSLHPTLLLYYTMRLSFSPLLLLAASFASAQVLLTSIIECVCQLARACPCLPARVVTASPERRLGSLNRPDLTRAFLPLAYRMETQSVLLAAVCCLSCCPDSLLLSPAPDCRLANDQPARRRHLSVA